MQFGIFTVGDVTTDPTTGTTVSENERIKHTVELARLAEQVVGLGRVVGEQLRRLLAVAGGDRKSVV